MRLPLSWLRDYVDVDLSPDGLAELLTLRGMEVSGIETGGTDWGDVVVGRLIDVERHPNAETLWVTRVDVAAGEPLEIVCGAQNIAPGHLVPVARVGAVLPGERRIERAKIRGVVSNGMLCSPIELGLGTDADGILILGTGDEHRVGRPLAELLGETVLDVDVKPNRGDALSMVGLAREVAAATGAELRLPTVSVPESGDAAADHVSVTIQNPDLCPRFVARWIGGVANGPSPEWMQRRLRAAGMRPISAVVDVTNYVMHELGQPQHAYDGDAVRDGRIVVRRAREGETLETIDHVQRGLDPEILLIADAEAPIGLAGIMGGASTEVGAATTNVILESAVFHGPTIRGAARRLGLRSEASMRHEKGIGPDLPRLAADRAAQLIAEIAGGQVARGLVDNDPGPHELRRIGLDLAWGARLLGMPLAATQVRDLLTPLGFDVADRDRERVEVTVPGHRLDVTEPADLAEEVARAHGYDRIVGRLPEAVLPSYRADPSEPRNRMRHALAGLGLDEVITYALIGEGDLRRTGYEPDAERVVRIVNPLSEDHAILRPLLYPSLLAALAENVRRRRPDAWLFELGKVYWRNPGRPTPRERLAESAGTGRYEAWELGIALSGAGAPRSIDERPRDADVAELKGIIDALHEALGAPPPGYAAEEPEARHPHRHPGRTGIIRDASGRAYGSLGEVHPRVAEAWDLPGRPVDASIRVEHLLSLVPAELRAVTPPTAQPIDRDLAAAFAEDVPVGEVLRVTRASAGPALVDLRLFDAYRGAQAGEGRVSYALSLRFQPAEPGDERAIDKAMNRVRGALQHHLGAEIR